MKLLLTSTGFSHEGITEAFDELIEAPRDAIKIGYIPTAANVEPDNKGWLIAQLAKFRKLGYPWVDIVDPSADGVDWQSRLEKVDALVIAGGNTFHLLNQVRKTGFDQWLHENLERKVYVGISAGSIIMTPSIAIASIDCGDENLCGIKDLTGLNFVDFEVSPHTPNDVSYEANAAYAQTTQRTLHAYDDYTALKVVNNEIEIAGLGTHTVYN